MTSMNRLVMRGVEEYGEGDGVELDNERGRLVVVAWNEGGHNSTAVDLEQLLEWVATNKPEVYSKHVKV